MNMTWKTAGLTLAAAMLCPVIAMAEVKTLSGSVAYRERMALPAGAVVDVKLLDVSRADAPAVTLAETTITPEHQVPVPFSLEYDDAAIEPGYTYVLVARISVDGKLLYLNTTAHPLFRGGEDATDIMVERVSGPLTLTGGWLAEDILGGGVVDRVQTVIEIAGDGTVSGSGGCNRLTGKAAIDGDAIRFGPIASTQMACPEAVMAQENRFFGALDKVRGWHIDDVRRKLTLLGEDGAALVVFSRM